MNTSDQPKRGEIWDIDLNPTKGQEINKTRPAVVISSDGIGKLRLKIVVPVTEWQSSFDGNLWHVPLHPTAANGLTKNPAAGCAASPLSFIGALRKAPRPRRQAGNRRHCSGVGMRR